MSFLILNIRSATCTPLMGPSLKSKTASDGLVFSIKDRASSPDDADLHSILPKMDFLNRSECSHRHLQLIFHSIGHNPSSSF